MHITLIQRWANFGKGSESKYVEKSVIHCLVIVLLLLLRCTNPFKKIINFWLHWEFWYFAQAFSSSASRGYSVAVHGVLITVASRGYRL